MKMKTMKMLTKPKTKAMIRERAQLIKRIKAMVAAKR